MSVASIDGFYAAYLSGKAAQGFAMLILRQGAIVGADSGAFRYDGRYSEATGNETLVTLSVTAPPNTPLLQGGITGPQGETNELNFKLPSNFEGQILRVETKHGPVNARLVKLRGLDD